MKMIVTITGPSASGKSVLERKLRGKFGYAVAKGTTTRPPRKEELENSSLYNFVSDEEYDQLLRDGQFVEYVVINNYRYGITKQAMDDAFAESNTVVMILNPAALAMTQIYYQNDPEVGIVSFFIDTDVDIRIQRLMRRHIEDVERVIAVKSDNIMRSAATVLENTLSRIDYTDETESTWIDELVYDHTFDGFTAENELQVIDQIECRKNHKKREMERGALGTIEMVTDGENIDRDYFTLWTGG